MVRVIFALGGAQVYRPCQPPSSIAIDRKIVAEGTRVAKRRAETEGVKRSRPRVLFIPTASRDDPEYQHGVFTLYAGWLRCEFRSLLLYDPSVSSDLAKEAIEWADVIYVGGGDTIAMLGIWHRFGVDQYLREAWERGTVLAGQSAGSLCWFSAGTSDRGKDGHSIKPLVPMRGLGFVNLLNIVHADSEPFRLDPVSLHELHAQNPSTSFGVVVDDDAAIEIRNERFRILASQPGKRAQRIEFREGEILFEELTSTARYRSLSYLASPIIRA